jgi:hypothetical protein
LELAELEHQPVVAVTELMELDPNQVLINLQSQQQTELTQPLVV